MAAITDRVNVGVGVVVERDGKFLLGKRIAPTKHGDGEWSFPGGKPDPGEDPITAAKRELHEETGLVADFLQPLGVWTYDVFPDPGYHFVTLYFIADVGDQEPSNTEPDKCEGWEWCDPYQPPVPLFSGVQVALGVVS